MPKKGSKLTVQMEKEVSMRKYEQAKVREPVGDAREATIRDLELEIRKFHQMEMRRGDSWFVMKTRVEEMERRVKEAERGKEKEVERLE